MQETLFLLLGGTLLLAFGGDFVVRVGLSSLGDRSAGAAAAMGVLVVTLGSIFPESSLIIRTQSLANKIEIGDEIYVPFTEQGSQAHSTLLSDRSTIPTPPPECPACQKFPKSSQYVDKSKLAALPERVTVSLPLGIIFGGCLINLLLIIGIAGLRSGKPISTSATNLVRDGIFLALGIAYAGLVVTGKQALLGSGDTPGFIGLGVAGLYLFAVVATERPQGGGESIGDAAASVGTHRPNGAMSVVYLAGGILALWQGADLIMRVIADHVMWLHLNDTWGKADAFAPAGLFLVAGIVAVPELMAALGSRGEPNLATRTLVSATILNLTAVLGLAVWRFDGIATGPHMNFAFDVGMLAVSAFLAVVLLWSKSELSRGESALLVLLYALYVGARFVPITPCPANVANEVECRTHMRTVANAADILNCKLDGGRTLAYCKSDGEARQQ